MTNPGEVLNTEQSTDDVSVNAEDITCPFCVLHLKNLDDLKKHIEITHLNNRAEHEKSSIETFPCQTCGLVLASVHLLQEHIISHQPQAYPCAKCNDIFSSEGSLNLHLASLHAENADIPHPEHDAPNEDSGDDESPPLVAAPTNINCDQCSFVAVDVQAIQIHIQNDHKEEHCQYCEHVANDRDELKDHMYEKHEDVIMVHTMAQQMNHISESFSLFETFKNEMSDVLRSILNNQNNILNNQNSMKQEMFLIRNKQLEETKQTKPSSSTPKESPSASTPSGASSSTNSVPPPTPPEPAVKVPALPKILYIGDSISASAAINVLEEATESKFVTASRQGI